MTDLVNKNMKFHEHSDILRANYKLDVNSLKLLGYTLNQIKFTDGHMIEVKKETLFTLIPTFRKKERLKKSLESLKTQQVEGIHKNLLFSVWISAVEEKQNSYVFEFPKLLLKYLVPFIAKEMTNINLYYYFKLTKYSSLRLYKILSQYINTTKTYIVRYEEIKNILGLNRKEEFENMREINNACKEISKNTDINIYSINRKMKNRKVETLTFFLEKNKNEEIELIEKDTIIIEKVIASENIDNSIDNEIKKNMKKQREKNKYTKHSEDEVKLVNDLFGLADLASEKDRVKFKIGKEKLFENIEELKEIGSEKLVKCYDLYKKELNNERENGFENKNIMSAGRFFTEDYKKYLEKASKKEYKSYRELENEFINNYIINNREKEEMNYDEMSELRSDALDSWKNLTFGINSIELEKLCKIVEENKDKKDFLKQSQKEFFETTINKEENKKEVIKTSNIKTNIDSLID